MTLVLQRCTYSANPAPVPAPPVTLQVPFGEISTVPVGEPVTYPPKPPSTPIPIEVPDKALPQFGPFRTHMLLEVLPHQSQGLFYNIQFPNNICLRCAYGQSTLLCFLKITYSSAKMPKQKPQKIQRLKSKFFLFAILNEMMAERVFISMTQQRIMNKMPVFISLGLLIKKSFHTDYTELTT